MNNRASVLLALLAWAAGAGADPYSRVGLFVGGGPSGGEDPSTESCRNPQPISLAAVSGSLGLIYQKIAPTLQVMGGRVHQVSEPTYRSDGFRWDFRREPNGDSPFVLDGRVVQVPERNVVLGEGFAIRVPSTEKITEGQAFRVWARPSGSYQYTSVLGAITKVPAYERADVRQATLNEFARAVQSGQSFLIEWTDYVVCPKCKSSSAPRQRTRCDRCNSTGKIEAVLIYRLTR